MFKKKTGKEKQEEAQPAPPSPMPSYGGQPDMDGEIRMPTVEWFLRSNLFETSAVWVALLILEPVGMTITHRIKCAKFISPMGLRNPARQLYSVNKILFWLYLDWSFLDRAVIGIQLPCEVLLPFIATTPMGSRNPVRPFYYVNNVLLALRRVVFPKQGHARYSCRS